MSRDYLALEGISQSMLKDFAADRAKYYRRHMLHEIPEEPPSDAQKFGSRLEAYLRGKSTGGIKIIPNDVMGKRKDSHGNVIGHIKSGNKYKEWLESQPEGVEVMKQEEFDEQFKALELAKGNIVDCPRANWALLTDGPWHVVCQWECPHTGLKRKAELDRVIADDDGNHWLIELKTARDTSEYRFASQAEDLGYAIQIATYLDAYKACRGIDLEHVVVAVDNVEPYMPELYQYPEDWLEDAREWNRHQMLELLHCMESDQPGAWMRPSWNTVRKLRRPKRFRQELGAVGE